MTQGPRASAAFCMRGPLRAILECVHYLIGIDEAGRGALAGPVSVGAVACPHEFDWREAFTLVTRRGEVVLRDSKKLSPQQREILFSYIENHGVLRHASALVDARTIDERGIVPAVLQAVEQAIGSLGVSTCDARVVLDAGLRAPSIWRQESFVRGDENIPAIALASIVAKVTRDRYMIEVAPQYEPYGFAIHKGYGTAFHRRAIREHGLSDLHRASFCSRIPTHTEVTM